MKFNDIPQRTEDGHYATHVGWDYLEEHLDRWMNEHGSAPLELEPDFQRGHVWDEARQVAFVEFVLSGGRGSEVIRFNCPGWMGNFRGPFVLVDGFQRITAALRFLRNEIPAFGHYYQEYEDRLRMTRTNFVFQVNDLKTREDVLRWYLEINTGGIVHTPEEVARVQALLDAEVA